MPIVIINDNKQKSIMKGIQKNANGFWYFVRSNKRIKIIKSSTLIPKAKSIVEFFELNSKLNIDDRRNVNLQDNHLSSLFFKENIDVVFQGLSKTTIRNWTVVFKKINKLIK
jgi:hypothetical protein